MPLHSNRQKANNRSVMHYPNSKMIELANTRCHCRISGQGDTLLLIHGLNSSLHTWEQWQDILAPHFQVVSIDLPGFGLSTPFVEPYVDIDQYMDFFAELFATLKIDSCHVAGNSFGGLMAWQLATHFPEFIKTLTLLDSTGYQRGALPFNYRLAIHPVFKKLTHRFTPRFLVEKGLKETYADASKVSDALIDRYHKLIKHGKNRQHFSRIVDEYFNPMPDYQAQIASIRQPTLVLWGEQDKTIPAAHVEYFKRDIANCQCIIYANVGHIPMEEHALQSAKDTLTFINNNKN